MQVPTELRVHPSCKPRSCIFTALNRASKRQHHLTPRSLCFRRAADVLAPGSTWCHLVTSFLLVPGGCGALSLLDRDRVRQWTCIEMTGLSHTGWCRWGICIPGCAGGPSLMEQTYSQCHCGVSRSPKPYGVHCTSKGHQCRGSHHTHVPMSFQLVFSCWSLGPVPVFCLEIIFQQRESCTHTCAHSYSCEAWATQKTGPLRLYLLQPPSCLCVRTTHSDLYTATALPHNLVPGCVPL